MSSIGKPLARPNKGAAAQPGGRRASTPRLALTNAPVGEARKALVARVTGVASGDRGRMLANIKKGLRFSVIGELEQALRASQKDIAQALSIPLSTLTRRKKEGVLHPDESDRVVRLARLKDSAVALMQGDDDAAISWLRTPLDILGGEAPLEHARTEMGARDVEDLIGRIRHGVFS